MGLRVVLWEQQPRADKTCCIKIYLNRDKNKYYGLNFYCLPREFDHKAGRVKKTRANAGFINSQIISSYNRFEKIMMENPSIGVDEITDIYESGGTSNKHSLLSFIEIFISECKSGKILRTAGTIQVYNATLNRLKEFNAGINFNSIDKDFYNAFTGWLREKGLINNGIGKHIKTLKTFLNEASERNIYKENEHRKKYFKVLHNETDAIYLDEKEIKKIIGQNLSKHPHLISERDRFLAAYYLLLRYSDSIRIERSMLFIQKKRLFIRLRAQKTNEEVIIPIKPIVKEILERNNYLLNFDTNQESNWKLKEIGRLSGIKNKVMINKQTAPKYKFITTHTARRSGATNLYLQGVPEKTIMDLGGWKKIDTFRKYIRVTKLETARTMADHPFFR